MASEYLLAWMVYLGAAVVVLVTAWIASGWILRGAWRAAAWATLLVIAIVPWPLADVLAVHDVAPEVAHRLWAPAVGVVLFATLFEGVQYAMAPLTALGVGIVIAWVVVIVPTLRRSSAATTNAADSVD